MQIFVPKGQSVVEVLISLGDNIKDAWLYFHNDTVKELLSDEEKDLVIYTLNCGTYGNRMNLVRNRMKQISADKPITNKTKFAHIMKRAFPKPDYIYTMYPLVKKHKILLPFAYPYRLIYSAVFKRRVITKELKYIKEVGNDNNEKH